MKKDEQVQHLWPEHKELNWVTDSTEPRAHCARLWHYVSASMGSSLKQEMCKKWTKGAILNVSILTFWMVWNSGLKMLSLLAQLVVVLQHLHHFFKQNCRQRTIKGLLFLGLLVFCLDPSCGNILCTDNRPCGCSQVSAACLLWNVRHYSSFVIVFILFATRRPTTSCTTQACRAAAHHHDCKRKWRIPAGLDNSIMGCVG